MSNRIFQSLVDQALSDLVSYYQSAREIFWDAENEQLIHPGEFGNYRENVVGRLLKLFLPSRLEIGSGFIITNMGDISTQCDLIIYDKVEAAPLENQLNQKFFPVETVVGVGEIKSNVASPSELRKILDKLAQVKKLRERTQEPDVFRSFHTSPYDPVRNYMDQIFTFVFANRFEFVPTSENVLNYPQNIPPRHWHNVVTTVADGTYSYKTNSEKTKNLFFPNVGELTHQFHSAPRHASDEFLHLKFFLMGFANGLKNVTSLSMDNVLYLTDNVSRKVE